MADAVAPEFRLFVEGQRRGEHDSPNHVAMAAGDRAKPVVATSKQASELIAVAAKRAAGLFRPTQRTEVVWIDGDSQLAVSLVNIEVLPEPGLLTLVIPVRCEETGPTRVTVTFAVGSAAQPAGLFASTHRRPRGPSVIVEAWGENLVAYAWQCVLGLVTGLAGAVGKDTRGNVLVPVELTTDRDSVSITPMARHRFSGSSGLLSTTTRSGANG